MQLNSPIRPRRAISLTPLIDVVFLLLVFFMLASTFLKFTNIPVTTAGRGAPTQTAPRDIALIHLNADQRVAVNGVSVPPGRLKEHLLGLHRNGIKQVIIRAKPGTTVSDLATVLTNARRIPFTAIHVID
jgi:biopolymer transport protein ExbD